MSDGLLIPDVTNCRFTLCENSTSAVVKGCRHAQASMKSSTFGSINEVLDLLRFSWRR